MNKYFFISIIALLFASCSTVSTVADYDKSVDFNKYKTFAFHKESMDDLPISDLDKKRILFEIDQYMTQKGFTKSAQPDFVISINTKENKTVDIGRNNFGYGFGYWGWGYTYGNYNRQTDVRIENKGVLYIEFYTNNEKNLIWQGIGSGTIHNKSIEKKEKSIHNFVTKILNQYPPNAVGSK